MYYKLHKISLNKGGSYTDSPKWLKNKKATINPKNNHDKCFQYALTVPVNYEQIKNHSERIYQKFIWYYLLIGIVGKRLEGTGKSFQNII